MVQLPESVPQPEISSTPDPAGDIEFLKQALKIATEQEEQVTKKISKYIDDIWTRNKEDNKHVRLEMVKHLRRARGEYEATKLNSIRAFKGSEVFVRLSENKCRSAESWIKDIYRSATDLPFDLEPTAVPELPEETRQQIQQEIQMQGQQMVAQAQMSGMPIDPTQISTMMNDWMEEAYDKALDQIRNDAKARCKRAANIIRDKNQEGGWNDAFKDFLWYFVRTKAGIIKGPVLTQKKKQVWQPDGMGGFALTAVDTLVNEVYCVSPFNFYPSKNMSKIEDGDVIEIHELSKQAIADLINVPGYKPDEVRAVMQELADGKLKAKWFTIDDETAVKQVEKDKNRVSATNPPTQSTTDYNRGELILAQEFYGTIPGRHLIEWGLEGDIDPDTQYQANCWKIGDHVIKAVINPDALGRKPYHISSWSKNPAWVWGEGLIEFAEPIEDIMNSIARALQNNIAIASGPQVEINKDRCDDKTGVYPWKTWYSTSMQMKEGPAVAFWQPQMHVGELVQAWQHFSTVLDNMTVPSYVQGAGQSGVTAGTATVFTQLFAAASRSTKAVVANIDDDVITKYNQMCYDFEMKFADDPALKGDARVVAKGVAGLLAKEQQAQRKVEYLQVVANPLFSQILGQKNLGAILGQIAKSNDIDLPDMERLEGDPTLEMLVQQLIQAQAGVADQSNGNIGNGGTGENPEGTNPDGSTAGVNNG